jgi:hypothetical protein
MNKLIVSAALLLAGVNLVPATTTLVSNLSPTTATNDDWMLGSSFLQPFTTGGAASVTTLQIDSYSGWSASDSPTVALLDSSRNLVASFVYSAKYSGVVTYSVSSYALLAASTYFIEVSGGAADLYLNLTRSQNQTGLPDWTIGNLSYRGVDSSASTTNGLILQFSLSGVPEPATSSLLAIGLGLFALARRRSRA